MSISHTPHEVAAPSPHRAARQGRTPGAQGPASPRWARPVLVRLAAMSVVLIAVQGIVQGSVMTFGDPFGNTRPLTTFLLGVVGSVLALVCYTWLVRRLERREVTELAPSGAVGGLARGALVGTAMFGAVLVVLAALGVYQVTGTGPVSSLLSAAGIMATAAVLEELVFRGVVFGLLETRLGTWAALLVSSALFGAMHLINNPHATVRVATAIALEAGLMLGAAYIATRTLWVPIGIHFAWNVVESLSGTTVSGTGGATPSLVTATLQGPTALTGGDFGPEGGVPIVVAGCAIAAAFLVVAARRGNLHPAGLRRTTPADSTHGTPTGRRP